MDIKRKTIRIFVFTLFLGIFAFLANSAFCSQSSVNISLTVSSVVYSSQEKNVNPVLVVRTGSLVTIFEDF